MMALHEAARALGGHVAANYVLCPVPRYSAEDRSLKVTFNEEGFTVTSFARDDWRECRRHVTEMLAGKIVDPGSEQLRRDDKNIERARRIWREAVEIKRSLAAIYLARRCLFLDGDRDWHGVI